MFHAALLATDRTIKYDPRKAVLGLPIGASVQLDVSGFYKLARASFAELEKKGFAAGVR